MKIKVEAEVYPTESGERVLQAMKNLFPKIDFNLVVQGCIGVVIGEGLGLESLENLKNMFRSRKIRAAAKNILKQSKVDGKLIFHMNKQAAYVGRASFTEPFIESPLPPIRVEVEAEDLDEVIEWLTE